MSTEIILDMNAPVIPGLVEMKDFDDFGYYTFPTRCWVWCYKTDNNFQSFKHRWHMYSASSYPVCGENAWYSHYVPASGEFAKRPPSVGPNGEAVKAYKS